MTRALWVLVPLFFAFLCAFIAARKGHRPVQWFFLGILFGVFATAVLLILPSRSGEARHAPDSVSDNSTHG